MACVVMHPPGVTLRREVPYVGAPEIKARRLVLAVRYHSEIGNPGLIAAATSPGGRATGPERARSTRPGQERDPSSPRPRSRLPRVAPCRCWRNTQAAVQARSGRSTTTACGRVHQTTAERHARPRRIHAPREEVHAIEVSGQKPNVSSTRVRVSSASARAATPRMTSTARGQPCDVRIDPHHPRPSGAWHSRAGRGHLA